MKWAKCWLDKSTHSSELSQIHRFDHLCPSRLGAHKPSVTRNSSRGGEIMTGNPSALSNASQTSGRWRVRQQSSRYTEITPCEHHHHFDVNEHYVLNALCFECIMLWMTPSLPLSPLANMSWTQVCEKIYTWATALKNKEMGPGQQKCYVPK